MATLSANVGTEVKPRRTGGRGRGAKTMDNAKAATPRRGRPPKAKDGWSLDIGRYEKLGEEMANAAVSSVKEAGTLWDRARTFFVDAQQHGQGEAAVVALFHPGDSIKGRKAPWYRTYKSLLSAAVKLNIPVTNEMGMTALQKEIKAAKDEAQDPEAKKTQLIGMFLRLAKGCLEKGISKATLAKELMKLEV